MVGLLVVALLDRVQGWYSLPRDVVLFTGVANLLYATPGLAISVLGTRAPVARRRLLGVLIIANALWAVVCIALLLRFGREASVLGLLHLVAEGSYVAVLAVLEWKSRRLILGDAVA
ncbi:MAG: hypothetical protein M3680_09445 [Myxococcota bacterium]|nr:hypothetical protein [Myxococcota bacterium]